MNQLVVDHLYCMYFMFYLSLLKGSKRIMTGRKKPGTAVSFTKYPYMRSCNILIMISYTRSVTRRKLENHNI